MVTLSCKDSNSLIHCLNNHEYDNKGELYVERANKFLKILKDK